jgi:fused signal recognition particle receptor
MDQTQSGTSVPDQNSSALATGDVVGVSVLGLMVVGLVGLGLTAVTRKRRQNVEDLARELDKPSTDGEPRALTEGDAPLASPAAAAQDKVPVAAGRAEDDARAAYRRGLERTRGGFFGQLTKLLTGSRELDVSVVAELEPLLLQADVGVKTTQKLLDLVKEQLSRGDLKSADKVREALKAQVLRMVDLPAPDEKPQASPHVMMVVGVNGVGKTTTIGKLANRYKAQGHGVVLGAGDTFRAAAVDQLKVWGDRAGVPTVEGAPESDSASVLFEAIKRGKAENAAFVICDTAGRLHTKINLMEELKKVRRVLGKAHEGAPHEVLLVVDGTTGQNAVVQAEQFHQALGLTGVVLTKLDGTAKGGVVLAICDALKLPIRYVGVGEKLEDLRPFSAAAFVDALFDDG